MLKSIKNMKIKKKLTLGFIFIAILGSISGIVSMFVIRGLNTSHSYALVNYGFAQGDIGKAMLMLSDSHLQVRDIVNFTDQKSISSAQKKLQEDQQKYDIYTTAIEKTLITKKEQNQYNTIKSAFDAYQAKREEVISLGSSPDAAQSTQAQALMTSELDPLYSKLYDSWECLINLNINTGNKLDGRLKVQGNIASFASLALSLITLVISVVTGTTIANGLSKPITQSVERLLLLEQGDLNSPVPEVNRSDEAGLLLSTLKNTVGFLNNIIEDAGSLLNEMAGGNFNISTKIEDQYIGGFQTLLTSMRRLNQDMSTTLSQINQSADQVASGSEQVSSGAQALSQGATEQASSIEELAATINEISNRVDQNAKNAHEASVQAKETAHELENGKKQMELMTSAMAEINSTSGEIGKIIKTIEDIAFQTNILALNAAVEAARAGEAGKGFAVVADEVRNLASKSAEASKSTAALIDRSIHSVQEGTAIANETAASISRIVESSEKAATLVHQISAASQEQASSIGQVTLGIDQISSVVQTNSATAEQSAAASQELSGQAQILKSLIEQFTLQDSVDYSNASASSEPAFVPETPAYQAEAPIDSEPSIPEAPAFGHSDFSSKY